MIMKIAKKAAFISSYPPGKCGIATFTADLITNIELASEGEFNPVICAIDWGENRNCEGTFSFDCSCKRIHSVVYGAV